MKTVRQIIILLIAGFSFGVLLASLVDFGNSVIWLFLILTLAFASLFFIYDKKKIFALIALVCLGLVLGLVRFALLNDLVDLPDEALAKAGENYAGLITADPDRRDNTTRLTVELHPSTGSTKLTTSPLRVTTLVVTDNFTDYKYGDKIEITGKLERPQNFLTQPSPKASARRSQPVVFDYQNYLKVRGIEQISYYPKIKILAREQGSIIKAVLFKLKNSFLTNLKLVLPEPSATLAGGLILGDKGGLGQKTETEFRQAGVSHIIVLSGYNISIVAEAVLFVFSLIVGAWSWLLGAGAIILFVMMTGGEAAAVRSAVMGVIALIARRYGRTYDAGVALVFAGFLMILWNPRLLAFDLGFQLSFLATLGMIYLAPVVERGIDSLVRSRIWLREKRLLTSEPVRNATSCNQVVFRTGALGGLKELISTTTGAQLAVYPWLLLQTGNATLIGFISNIFILPAVPIAMFLSFATGITGFISSYLSFLISYPTYFLLSYILKLAHLFSLL